MTSIKRILYLFAIVALLAMSLSATEYYVKNGGNDAASGLDDDNAWETIAKVNGESFSGDDIIYFKRGDTWREQLTVPDSGTSGHQIKFGAYGEGADPIINGADVVSTWNAYINSSTTYPGANADDVYTRNAAASIYDADNLHWGENTGQVRDSGIRFLNHLIPKDANIISAFVRLTAYANNSSSALKSVIAAENTDEPAAFSTFADFDGRGFSTAQVTWDDLPSWVDGTQYDTPDIAAIIDEVTSYTNWTSGDDIVIFLNDDGSADNQHRQPSAYNYNGGSEKPELHITWGYPNVWQATLTTDTRAVFFDGVMGNKQTAIADVDSENDWYWASNVLYVYSTEDPDGAVVIEAAIRDAAIYADGKTYITMDGIHATKTRNLSNKAAIEFRGSSTNAIITNCTVSDYRTNGIRVTTGSNDSVISDNDIYSQGVELNSSIGVGMWDDAGSALSNVNITGNTIYNSYYGLSIHYLTGGTISGNTIYDCNRSGISFTGCDSIIVENNVVHDVCVTAQGSGIQIGGNPGADTPDCIVRDNIVYNVTQTVGDGAGIILDYEANGCDVYRNLIYDTEGPGIIIFSCSGTNNVYYNLCHDTGTTGVTALKCGLHINEISSQHIYNNVFYNPGAIGLYINGENGTESESNLIKNNIFSGSTSFAVYVNSQYAVTGNVYNNNCYYLASGKMAYWHDTTEYTALSDWQTAQSQDANSMELDPLMIDPGSDNFTLQVGSPCINRGTFVGLLLDYLGLPVPIGHRPDIGAYEHKNGGAVIH